MKLILFDIDGTLLYSNGNARKALMSAVKEVFGDNIDDSISMAGKTDKLIIYDLLAGNYGQKDLEKYYKDIFQCYLGYLKKYFTIERGVGAFDGVFELLTELSKRDDVILALLTGNIERGARIKLETRNLNDFFGFGAFGDDGFYRNELPDVAVDRAYQKYNRQVSGKDIVIIGDTVNDVYCGQHLGVKSIAICSNKSTEKELKESNPDFFFHDFLDTDKVISAIMS